MFEHFTLWKAIKVGGPVMYVLMGCSVASIAVIIDRLFYYTMRSRISRESFMLSIRQALLKSEFQSAANIAKTTTAPFAAVILAALNFVQYDEREITEAIERQVIIESNNLERRTSVIGTIASTAVYIGLLGTVWGIMKTFQDIAQAGSGGIDVVIGGIAEALVCTAAGLCVAIPAVIAHNYFVKRINRFILDMELCGSEVIGLIKRSKEAKGK